MLYVSLYVEGLRSRPVLVFWLAALAQAVLWALAPTFFYAAPPGNLPDVLAIGHEFRFGTAFGPPLAFWLAEIAFRAEFPDGHVPKPNAMYWRGVVMPFGFGLEWRASGAPAAKG